MKSYRDWHKQANDFTVAIFRIDTSWRFIDSAHPLLCRSRFLAEVGSYLCRGETLYALGGGAGQQDW
jgi:hypothetical protein